MQCADSRIVRSARLSLYESVLLRSTKMANLRKKKFFDGSKKTVGWASTGVQTWLIPARIKCHVTFFDEQGEQPSLQRQTRF